MTLFHCLLSEESVLSAFVLEQVVVGQALVTGSFFTNLAATTPPTLHTQKTKTQHATPTLLCHGHGARSLCVLCRDVSQRLDGRHLGARLGGEGKDVVENFAGLHFLHIRQFPPLGFLLPLLHFAHLGVHLVLSFQSSASRCVGPEFLQVVVRKLKERFLRVGCNNDLFATFFSKSVPFRVARAP